MSRRVATRAGPITAEAIIVASNNSGTTCTLVIEGTPQAQQCPRMQRNTEGGFFVYNPSQAHRDAVRATIRGACEELRVVNFPLFSPAQKLKVQVEFQVKNHLKDLDNLLKFILDAMETVVYPNDRNIFEIIAKKKIVGDNEKTKLTVQEITEEEEEEEVVVVVE